MTILTYNKGGTVFKGSFDKHLSEKELIKYCEINGLIFLRCVHRSR